jgi:hypothetical protein
MAFAGMNFLAIVVAAVAGWVFGAAYYGALARPWLRAQGLTVEEHKQRLQSRGAAAYVPYAVAFLAELAMAWMLAGTLGHLGQVTLRNGVISALFLWFGFVLTTAAVNNMFGMRKPMLTVIDAGHWLAVLLLMGAIVGGMGV